MSKTPASSAWDSLVAYANEADATVYTISREIPNSIDYDEDENAVVLVSRHHAASGEPFLLHRPTFGRVWNRLRDGAVLSRDDETEYESLPALLDGQYRASGVMGALDTVFEEFESATNPVRIWIDE